MEEVTLYNDEIEVHKQELKIELEINEIKKKDENSKKNNLTDDNKDKNKHENKKRPINKKI